MELIDTIKSDLYRYYGKTNLLIFVKVFFLIEGFRYMFFHRIKFFLSKRNPFYWLLFLILRSYGYKYGFQILTGDIGKGFYIGHFGTIIINGAVRIGKNVNVSPGVVIGQVSRGPLKGVPTIGNSVWIGSNALIVGKITVGNNVLIAPGTYVNFDVPNYSLVKGNPGVLFPSKGVDDYVCNAWVRS